MAEHEWACRRDMSLRYVAATKSRAMHTDGKERKFGGHGCKDTFSFVESNNKLNFVRRFGGTGKINCNKIRVARNKSINLHEGRGRLAMELFA